MRLAISHHFGHAVLSNIGHQFPIGNRGARRHAVNGKFSGLDYIIGAFDFDMNQTHGAACDGTALSLLGPYG